MAASAVGVGNASSAGIGSVQGVDVHKQARLYFNRFLFLGIYVFNILMNRWMAVRLAEQRVRF